MRWITSLIVISMLAAISGCGIETATDSNSMEARNDRRDPSARPIDVTAAKFREYMRASDLVLVKFGAPWCAPCRKVDIELDRLAANNPQSLTVLRVDVDESPGLARRYDISAIPRLMLFANGKKLDDWTGFQSARELQTAVDQAEPASSPAGELKVNPYAG